MSSGGLHKCEVSSGGLRKCEVSSGGLRKCEVSSGESPRLSICIVALHYTHQHML